MSDNKRGFAAFSPEKLIEISRKGGRRKVAKGFAKMDPQRLKEISSQSLKKYKKENEDEHSSKDQQS